MTTQTTIAYDDLFNEYGELSIDMEREVEETARVMIAPNRARIDDRFHAAHPQPLHRLAHSGRQQLAVEQRHLPRLRLPVRAGIRRRDGCRARNVRPDGGGTESDGRADLPARSVGQPLSLSRNRRPSGRRVGDGLTASP